MRSIWLAGLALGLCATGAFGAEEKALPTGEEILKGMVEKAEKVKVMEYDYTRQWGAGAIGMTAAKGHVVAARVVDGGKVVEKFFMTEGYKYELYGKPVTVERKEVCDGEWVWSEEWWDNKLTQGWVRKHRLTGKGWSELFWSPVMNKELAEWYLKNEKLGKVSEETIDGKKMYVFEMIYIEKHGNPDNNRTKLYVREEGMTLGRVIWYGGKKGEEQERWDFGEVETAGEVDKELFVFKIPKDAEVHDTSLGVEDEYGNRIKD